MPTSQPAWTCHSLDKTWSAERQCSTNIPGGPLILFRKVSNHLGLPLSPELEGHSWQDIEHYCCPCSVFPVGIKALEILSSTPQSLILCFCFFFSFFLQRESARVGRGRRMSCKGGSILFCRAWFVIALAIKRKTMFVYCCFYSISSSTGTGRAAFSKKEFFAAVLLMSISAFEYLKFSVE